MPAQVSNSGSGPWSAILLFYAQMFLDRGLLNFFSVFLNWLEHDIGYVSVSSFSKCCFHCGEDFVRQREPLTKESP